MSYLSLRCPCIHIPLRHLSLCPSSGYTEAIQPFPLQKRSLRLLKFKRCRMANRPISCDCVYLHHMDSWALIRIHLLEVSFSLHKASPFSEYSSFGCQRRVRRACNAYHQSILYSLQDVISSNILYLAYMCYLYIVRAVVIGIYDASGNVWGILYQSCSSTQWLLVVCRGSQECLGQNAKLTLSLFH